jgi:hypothetical protein
MSISSFGWTQDGEEINVLISLCRNGKYAIASNSLIVGIRFDYPPVTDESEEPILVGFPDLEEIGELGQEIRGALEQQLNLDAT